MTGWLAGGWAILLRDAARSARRWQTYAARTFFSGALLVFVLGAIWGLAMSGQVDRAEAARYSRWIFIAAGAFQAFLATCIAPIVCASAVIEERREGTLEPLVLTRLSSLQIHAGTLVARLLLTSTVILSALPVQALLQTVGGFSTLEVVAGTANALVAAVVMGTLGAFFAVFTRSAVLAAAAALSWSALIFLGAPPFYMLFVKSAGAAGHVSPLFAHAAEDLRALGPAALVLPVVLLATALGARVFELRVSGARLERYFEWDAWHWPQRFVALSVLAVWWTVAIPIGVGLSWLGAVNPNPASGFFTYDVVIPLIGEALVWIGFAGGTVVFSSFFLQITMDIVMVIDRALAAGRDGRVGRAIHVWRNPLLWRALHPGGWQMGGPLFGGWLFGVYLLFQSGVWIIPGALAALGIVQAAGAVVLAASHVATQVERERREGTLSLLMLSTQSNFALVVGLLSGAVAPSLAMLIAAWPLWLAGRPFFAFILDSRSMELEVVESVLACLWTLPVLAAAAIASLGIALRVRRPQNALTVSVGLIGLLAIGAPALALLFTGRPWFALPFQLVAPVLARGASWQHMLVSTGLYAALALVLFGVVWWRARVWGLRHV